jgi:hypothetical protein
MRGFGVWQDSQGFLRALIGDLYPVLLSTAIDNNPHVFTWRCIEGVWSMWLDGTFVASDESDYRPSTLFFGHPTEPRPYWTTQEIDYVHIEPIGSVTVGAERWGSIKASYRNVTR